jgi:glycosyltransferase involved in cell wall biosynthesis
MQPGKIDSVSGGYIYNKNIIEGVRAHSVDVELLIPGTDFPFPSEKSIEMCREFFRKIERSSIVVVDSLILGTIPKLIEEFAEKLIIAGMIHLPLSLGPDFTEDEKEDFRERELTSFNYSKLLIVTSEFLKSEIVKMGIDEEKIHVVTPGINKTINERNYPENPINMLCVSRISEAKGQLDLLKALENLRYFNWNVTFCGGFDIQDEYFKTIRKSISNSGIDVRITFTGEISGNELEKFYQQADLLILTSYFETYSMVLQEAMAFKIPIISTSTGATTQTADSQVAKFYKPGDITKLGKHLLSVLGDSEEYKNLVNGYRNLNLNFGTWNKKANYFLHIVQSK